MCQWRRYCSGQEDFEVLAESRRSMVCELCQSVGWVIRNGLVYGYRAGNDERVVVAQRLLCSNRGKRRGCGGSMMVRVADAVRKTLVPAPKLWEFFDMLRQAPGVHAAWSNSPAATCFSLTTAYRLSRRLDKAQSWVRSKIATLLVLSGASQRTDKPLLGLIDDLRSAFAGQCPVSAFQVQFQQGFFVHEPQRPRRMCRRP